MKNLLKSTLVIAVTVGLAACGNDGYVETGVPAALDISGTGIKGALAFATVNAFKNPDLSTVVATTQTDKDGDYTLVIPSDSSSAGTYLVRLTADEDTTMICDATLCVGGKTRGETIPSADLKDLELSTITNADGSGAISAEMNALTTLATNSVLSAAELDDKIDLSDATTLKKQQENASRVVGSLLGVNLSETNIFDVDIVDASESKNVSTTDEVAATLTLINASLSGLEPASGETLADAINGYVEAVSVVIAAPNATGSKATDALAEVNMVQAEISQEVTDLAVDIEMDTGNEVDVKGVPTDVDTDFISDIKDDIGNEAELTGGTGGTGGTGTSTGG